MIERNLVKQKKKEFQVHKFISDNLNRVGHSHTKVQRTPLGEKIIIFTSRPGLVVGSKGSNIKRLTGLLKTKFGLENPQIEIAEVENVNLDANIVAERITNSLEKYGTGKFKGVGHKVMGDVMNSGALGIEIIMSGKIPGARARSWRFYTGYLKKCGELAVNDVLIAYKTAQLKTGSIGIKVSIMPPWIKEKLPDNIQFIDEIKEEVTEQPKEEKEVIKQAKDKKKSSKKLPKEETQKEKNTKKQSKKEQEDGNTKK